MGIVVRQSTRNAVVSYLGVGLGFLNVVVLYPRLLSDDQFGLTRLLISESGDRFWRTISDTPIDDLGLSDSEKRYARTLFFFEPSPYPSRAVFLATPHRGSHIARIGHP